MLTVSHPPSSVLPHPINPFLPRKLFLEQNLTKINFPFRIFLSFPICPSQSSNYLLPLTSSPACVLQPFKHCFRHDRERSRDQLCDFWTPLHLWLCPPGKSFPHLLPHQPLRETYPRYISILQSVFLALLLTIQSAARLRGWTALSVSLPTVPGKVLAVD